MKISDVLQIGRLCCKISQTLWNLWAICYQVANIPYISFYFASLRRRKEKTPTYMPGVQRMAGAMGKCRYVCQVRNLNIRQATEAPISHGQNSDNVLYGHRDPSASVHITIHICRELSGARQKRLSKSLLRIDSSVRRIENVSRIMFLRSQISILVQLLTCMPHLHKLKSIPAIIEGIHQINCYSNIQYVLSVFAIEMTELHVHHLRPADV